MRKPIVEYVIVVLLAALGGAGLGLGRCWWENRQRDEVCRVLCAENEKRVFDKTEEGIDSLLLSEGIDVSKGSNCVAAAQTDKAEWLSLIGYNYLDVKCPVKAHWLFLRSAELGNSSAMCQLGWSYQVGLGVPTNFVASATWYRFAHEQGNVWGTLGLARAYDKGIGVQPDRQKAIEFYRLVVKGYNEECRKKARSRLAQLEPNVP